jgi:hypothetical protein
VWVLWHLARIEDVTMNLLAAGSEQVLTSGDWASRLKTEYKETGNALDRKGIEELSRSIDTGELRAYRCAVGRRTREVVQALTTEDLGRKVDSRRLDRSVDEGAVVDSTRWLVEYWGKKTIGGLLLMPPTRHNFVHLNEAERIGKKVSRKKE